MENQCRHEIVRSQEAVTAVLVIVGSAVVIGRIARSGIVRIHQWHMTLAAFHRFSRVALVVPVAGGLVVVLILQLDPAVACVA